MADAEINRLVTLNDAAARENAALVREIEALRQNLNMKAITPPAPTKISTSVQLSINEDLKNEEKYTPFNEEKTVDEEQATIMPRDEILSAPQEEPVSAEEITPAQDTVAVEAAPAEEPKQEEPPKKKRVRSMFDLITFDKL